MSDPEAPAAQGSASASSPKAGDTAEYRVLARKYRPQTFDDLIGQGAMVRTLSNAFETGRVAHGFILTGVRGVGKTTTARIIARGLNCIGPDGQGGSTIHPCGACEPCISIAESRNVDVLEMDAASRTGINDIREIIDSVRYRPASCRYKVYIIDEVHMLSTAAFNGLLKTLEEPPPHVKFIFATTEIRKVPVTVLSRCQRFDLRRIEPETMIAYLARIAGDENATPEDEALALIARASEGSARDAVSLLDQALAHGTADEAGRTAITADNVRDMLGLADRSRVLDLFDLVMKGEIAGALTELRAQYDTGADPIMILNDLLEVVHWLTRLTVVPSAAEDPATSPGDRARGQEMVRTLPVNVLTRAWQILLKGLEEAARAPSPIAASEMVLIRLGYASSLKTPDDLLKMLEGGQMPAAAPSSRPAPAPNGGTAHSGGATAPPASAHGTQAPSGPPPSGPTAYAGGGGAAVMRVAHSETAPERAPEAARPDESVPDTVTVEGKAWPLKSFEDMVAIADEAREALFAAKLRAQVRPIRFSPGSFVYQATENADRDLASTIGAKLREWTGVRWLVSIENTGGGPTLREMDAQAAETERAQLVAHPLVDAVLKAFPGGDLGRVRALDETVDTDDAGSPAALAAGTDDDDDDML